jgi:hypothetical protein
MRSVLGGSRRVMSALICGLDMHKDSTYATILDSSGKIVSQIRMNSKKMLLYLSSFNVGRVGLEASNRVTQMYKQVASNAHACS